MDLNAFQWTDANSDGIGDTGLLDANLDGYADTAAIDGNFDGYVEGYAWDTNADGVFDTVTMDTDLDGYLDATGWDVNADGIVDYVAGPDTGGQVVDVSGLNQPTAIVGPSSAPSPQANLAGLLGYTDDPLAQVQILNIIERMNDTSGIWSTPDRFYW